MSSFKPECRKFQPNIFNKAKCSNCFRQRDEHSDAALESNRASRKVSKCGYLFVAPDWDFSNPLNRTKRWQRRWFVLYDDGELTYSVDDLPATIPQSTIDMNRVLEVSEAEDITGNQFALAITSPDRATFVKGTCREESRWWREVLSVFPRALKHGRHKRNATFPGMKTSSASLQQSRAALGRTPSPSLGVSYDSEGTHRVRFNSCAADVYNFERPSSAPTFGAPDDPYPVKDTKDISGVDSDLTISPLCHSTPHSAFPSSRLICDEHKENTPPSYMQDYNDNPPTSESPPTQDKVVGHRPRTRRAVKREARGLMNPRSKSEVSLLPPFAAPSHSSSTNTSSGLGGRPALQTNISSPSLGLYHSRTSVKSSENRIDALSSSMTPLNHTDTMTSSLSSLSLTPLNRSDLLTSLGSLSPVTPSTTRSNALTLSMTSLTSSYVSPYVTSPLTPRHHGTSFWDEDRDGSDSGKRIRYSDFPSMKRFSKTSSQNVIDAPTSLTSSGDLSQKLITSSSLEESKREVKLKDIAASITRPRGGGASPSYLHCEPGVRPTRENEVSPEVQEKLFPPTSADVTDSSQKIRCDSDPHGKSDRDPSCLHPPASTQRVDLPAEEILYSKKGWLLKQGSSQEWCKHWFVLEGNALKFYRDPGAEDNGILDGILDLGMVKDVREKDVGRNYGFVVMTWDDRNLVFAALTCGIRANWTHAMRAAANLSDGDRPLTLGEKLEREMVAAKDSGLSSISPTEMADRPKDDDVTMTSSSTSSTSSRRRSRLTSEVEDEEDFKTASESSFVSAGALSSQDDVSRTDGASSTLKSGSNSKARSRSSLPPSRRSTREDIPPHVPSSTSSHFSSSLPQSTVSTTAVNLLSDTESVYLRRLNGRRVEPERDSPTSNASKKDVRTTEMLDGEVEAIKSKMEPSQLTNVDREDERSKVNVDQGIEVVKKQLLSERREWERRLGAEEARVRELRSSQSKQVEITRKLTRSLQDSEAKISGLTKDLENERSLNLKSENSKLNQQTLDLKDQLQNLQESLKAEKSESYKWKDLVKELRSLLDGRNQDMEQRKEEVSSLREKLKTTQAELDTTSDRLRRGIEENETLCGRLRQFQRDQENSDLHLHSAKVRKSSSTLSVSSSRERFVTLKRTLPRMDSLSDLTNCDLNFDPEELDKESLVEEYQDLRARFEKAVGEIKALKKELREAERGQDEADLVAQRLKAELNTKSEDFRSQMVLMQDRLHDLTNKLTNSDKMLRATKTKMSRAESRDRRRTLSLKGKESFTLSKDLELKISDLEIKVNALSGSSTVGSGAENASSVAATRYHLKETRRSKSFEESTKGAKHRRKSLDGGQPTPPEDALKAVLRLNALEDKVSTLSGKPHLEVASNVSTLSLDSMGSTSRTVTPRSKSPLISPAASKRNLSSRSCLKPATSLSGLPSAADRSSKSRRFDSDPKILKVKVLALEKVLSALQAKLSEGLSCARTLECNCSSGSPADPLLRQLEEILSTSLQMAQSRCLPVERSSVSRVQPFAQRLQEVLKEKLNLLNQRRQELRSNGKWNREAQLKQLAEKLAFETVLLSQVAQKAKSPHCEDSERLQELIEAHRKLSFLEKKVTDPSFDMAPLTPIDFYTNLLAEKLTLAGYVWASVSSQTPSESNRKLPPLRGTCKDLLKKLLDRERDFATVMSEYKEKKLTELARVMARESVTGASPPHDESILVEEVRLREAWATAQDILNEEIGNMEAAQSVTRMANLLAKPEVDLQSATQNNVATLDRLQTCAEDSLRQEMEESAFTLSRKYEEALAAYRGGDETAVASSDIVMAKVLEEFATVIAQKALVDGQLAVAASDDPSESEPLLIVEDERLDEELIETAGDVVASETHLLMFLGAGGDPVLEEMTGAAITQSEFNFLFNRSSNQLSLELSSLSSDTNLEDLSHVGSLTSLKRPPSPKIRKRTNEHLPRKTRRASDLTGMLPEPGAACKLCEELRQELTRLRRSVDAKKNKEKVVPDCSKCPEYLEALKHLEEEHRVAMENLEGQHQAEMDRLRDQVKYDPPTRDSDDELTELKRRLCLLEEGYEAQIAALKKEYSEALGSQSDVCEENIRQRYQTEIEHLRDLCEKGLTAMETSHRRVVSEMEAAHRREISQLKTEKEEALAEETAATLAALDAMRKAHETEVQKEVNKFKEEWSRRAEDSRSNESGVALEQQELRDVRREILTLSEKYSGKCLEMAGKEQKMEGLQRQLTEAKAQVRSLEERNRLLKQRLSSHLCHIQTVGKKSAGDTQDDVDLSLKEDQIAWLNQKLQKSGEKPESSTGANLKSKGEV